MNEDYKPNWDEALINEEWYHYFWDDDTEFDLEDGYFWGRFTVEKPEICKDKIVVGPDSPEEKLSSVGYDTRLVYLEQRPERSAMEKKYKSAYDHHLKVIEDEREKRQQLEHQIKHRNILMDLLLCELAEENTNGTIVELILRIMARAKDQIDDMEWMFHLPELQRLIVKEKNLEIPT